MAMATALPISALHSNGEAPWSLTLRLLYIPIEPAAEAEMHSGIPHRRVYFTISTGARYLVSICGTLQRNSEQAVAAAAAPLGACPLIRATSKLSSVSFEHLTRSCIPEHRDIIGQEAV